MIADLIRDSRSDEALQTATIAELVRLLLQAQRGFPVQRVGKVWLDRIVKLLCVLDLVFSGGLLNEE
jgi:hypothetical protein